MNDKRYVESVNINTRLDGWFGEGGLDPKESSFIHFGLGRVQHGEEVRRAILIVRLTVVGGGGCQTNLNIYIIIINTNRYALLGYRSGA